MIGSLHGKVLAIEENNVILQIPAGIGYIVHLTSANLMNIVMGQEITLWISTQTKENETTLFGFVEKHTKIWFETLITVQGVGGKVALAILSALSIDTIQHAILMNDVSYFKKVSGIGPKLASRIINELKSKKDFKLGGATIGMSDNHLMEKDTYNIASDAASVMANLGFSKTDAYQIAVKICTEQQNIDLEELIRLSLQAIHEAK